MNRAFLFLLFLLLAGKMCAQQVAGTLTLKEAEQRFLERNLSLIAERYNIDMAQAQVLQAKLFENPVISLEQNVYNRLNGKYFDFGKEGEAVVEIEQVIHLAGQRNKQVRLEKINKEIAEYQFEEVMRTLRQELNEKFVEVYFLSKSIAIYEKEVNSLQALLGGMKVQQEKGNISLMEISRLESMLFSLKKEKNERESDLLTTRGELNLLLNLPEDTQVQLSLDEEVLQQLDLSQLSFADLKAIINERPDQKIARSTVNASRANLKLQKSMAFPEFSVKGNYDRVGNFINDYFAIGVSLSVPIFNRNQGNIKAARFSIQQAGVQQEYAANRADMELFTAYTSLEKATQLYQSTNTDLERNFEKLITGVNENFTRKNISLLEFIDYYDSYKETCIQLYEIKKNVFLAMENLNTVVGQNVLNY
ncbi:TolC family protein [Bacteroides thetaiotaomicron]|uniref:TolC family protein n=1 Tax=Bacteroides thetaiotaomicron TaxID=818 RepID=UPI002165337A|nr:TolC family protein [Bacteroides thetaiotaomicron]MCS3183257.1 TolC family protein [Bacteroides thetaiotaomicron]